MNEKFPTIAVVDNWDGAGNLMSIKKADLTREYCEQKHGLICKTIIENKLTNAKIIPVLVFKPGELNAGIESFLRALMKCNELCVDIVNLSLGSIHPKDFHDIQRMCQYLIARGIIIVASCDNNGNYTVPACSDGVIGVEQNDDLLPNKMFIDTVTNNIIINAKCRINVFDGIWEIPSSSSFATAIVTSKIAEIFATKGLRTTQEIINEIKENTPTYIRKQMSNQDIPEILIVGKCNEHSLYEMERFFENKNYNVGYYQLDGKLGCMPIGRTKILECYGYDIRICLATRNYEENKADFLIVKSNNRFKVYNRVSKKLCSFITRYAAFNYIVNYLEKGDKYE